jgi:hypothetical protein
MSEALCKIVSVKDLAFAGSDARPAPLRRQQNFEMRLPRERLIERRHGSLVVLDRGVDRVGIDEIRLFRRSNSF